MKNYISDNIFYYFRKDIVSCDRPLGSLISNRHAFKSRKQLSDREKFNAYLEECFRIHNVTCHSYRWHCCRQLASLRCLIVPSLERVSILEQKRTQTINCSVGRVASVVFPNTRGSMIAP